MNDSLHELEKKLGAATEGMTFGSESSYPVTPVLCPCDSAPFTTERLLKAAGLCEDITDLGALQDFAVSHLANTATWAPFISLLRETLTNLRVVSITSGEGLRTLVFIGQQPEGDFVALTPGLPTENVSGARPRWLLAEVEDSDWVEEGELGERLLAEAPPLVTSWGMELEWILARSPRREHMLACALSKADLLVCRDFDDAEFWSHDEEESARFHGFLKQHLVGLRRYTMGWYATYAELVVGETPERDWAGVQSIAVMT